MKNSTLESILLRDGTGARLPGLVMLNLGSGLKRCPGWVNVDSNPAVNPTIVHDLNDIPWPFKENSVDGIMMDNCLEHLEDISAAMLEIYRILRPGATAYIIVPYAFSDGAIWDPTHRHFFCPETFWFYTVDGPPLTRIGYPAGCGFTAKVALTSLDHAWRFRFRNLIPFRWIWTKFIRNMYDGIEARMTKV